MTTDPVCEFYTRHPYPPPVENLDRARDEWRDPDRHRADYHLFWPHRRYRADLDILVAGCGTWQAAKYAACRPDARVIGIDVSTTSLDHTERLKRKYDLTNLETRHLSIEGAADIDRRFDLVVCTGVLHHLADPDAGLSALRSVLKDDGALHLMVYAPYGRTGIYMLKEYCRRLGVQPSEHEIQDLMAVLKVLPRHHPLAAVLGGSRDANNADALADALLNPRDRAYSVPQLFEFIERNGLAFGRWYSQAPYLPQCGAAAATAHASRLAALPEQERYAAMELWRGTLSTHSVVAYRNDRGEDPATVLFAEAGNWLRYVPVKLPGTLCLQERLPPGAAAVLLSRYHTSPDLIVPIDTVEKRMFDAIDGRRNIAQIGELAGGMDLVSRAHAFFEKLWCFDQIVVDASRAFP
jgi:SAM-dependent methyltransferase